MGGRSVSTKKEKQRAALASKRWRENNPERAKQVGRNAYHRRRESLGLPRRVLTGQTAKEKAEAKRAYQREWRKKWAAENPERAKLASRIHYWSDPEKHREESRDWYSRNKANVAKVARRRQLRILYGITPEQYDALGQGCAVCGLEKHKNGYRLHVDHDHDTGVIRGKLCSSCNTGIGCFKNDPELLRKAALYLEAGIGPPPLL